MPPVTTHFRSQSTLNLAQDVIKDMKRQFKAMSHHIEQLKDEITVMDHSLVGMFVLPVTL